MNSKPSSKRRCRAGKSNPAGSQSRWRSWSETMRRMFGVVMIIEVIKLFQFLEVQGSLILEELT